jgi:hypothetical protein
LSNCTSLRDINALSVFTKLNSIDLSGCEQLTMLTPLASLTNLTELNLSDSPEIHTLAPLKNLPNLKKLHWVIPSKVSEVLLASALLRSDMNFISTHAHTWLQHLSLSKEPEIFFRELCQGFALLKDPKLFVELAERGRDFGCAQLDVRAWRFWALSVLVISNEGQKLCFERALEELIMIDDLEGRASGVIGVMGQLSAERPSWALTLVEEHLQAILNDEERRRVIAPAAASFYAQWGDHNQVELWISHGTHPEAPHWRDQVLLALVEVAAQHKKWGDVEQYLKRLNTDELRDQAHMSVGTMLIDEEPVQAALAHLSNIIDPALRVELALELSECAVIYKTPKALSHLVLNLQAHPTHLSQLLTRLLAEQPEIAETLNNLFEISSKTSITSPSEHPALISLKEIDMDSMTPMSAFQTLYKLKEGL